MSTIVTRAGKGSPLTNTEVDTNFTNLNTDKIQSGDSVATLDINGGTIDGTTIGGASAAVGTFTQVNVDNLRLDGNAITSTNTNGNIALTPNGVGEVDISKVDIDSGTIDGTAIGGASAAAGSFTTLNTSGQVVFNDAGADVDFRVEGDTDANLLFVDASTDRVGVGTNAPDALLTVDGIASFGAGAAATPSIARAGDLNTGIFFPAADTIAFAEGGAEAMRIDSSGNMLLGTTTTPSGYNGNFIVGTSGGGFFCNGSTAGGYGTISNQATIFFTNATERMRIDSSGNVGIGTTSPGVKLDVSGGNIRTIAGTNASIGAFAANGSSPQFLLGNSAGTAHWALFQTLGGGGEQGSFNIFDAVASAARFTIAANGIITMSAYGAGTATFSAAGAISSVSDETWKIKDGVPVDPDAMLQMLEPGYWYYNEEKAPHFGADRQLGFYAQNVNAAIGPEAAPTPEEGKPWGYYDRSVLAVAVMSLKNALNSIQELKAELDTVKAELATLKG